MPRGDVVDALSPGAPPGSLLSGFWAVVPVPPSDAGEELVLLLRARLADGSEETTELGRVEVEELPEPLELDAAEPSPDSFVCICMATHEPSPELFRGQVESLRAQTHANWVCVVSDDCSGPGRFEAIERELDGDPRFTVSRSPERIGFYRNFERALALAPAAADFVALADQDDRWDPDKLETLLREIGDAQLVYSDARIVDSDGTVLSETYWQERRNNHEDIASRPDGELGHRRRVAVPARPARLRAAVPARAVPPLPRPLAGPDGARARGRRVRGQAALRLHPARRRRARARRREPHGGARRARARLAPPAARPRPALAAHLLRGRLQAAPVRDDPPAPLRRADGAAEAPLAASASPGRTARCSRSAGWPRAPRASSPDGPRRSAPSSACCSASPGGTRPRASVRAGTPPRRVRLDTRPPARLALKPGKRGPEPETLRVIHEKLAPLDFAPRDDAPERVNLLIPSIDLDHFFGGYIGKFNLAAKLAERGLRVRLVTVDPVGPLPPGWRDTVESYSGLAGLFDNVEVVFGRESPGIEVEPLGPLRRDHLVDRPPRAARARGQRPRALPLPDPGVRAVHVRRWGASPRSPHESYGFPHHALFSTELLRDWFRGRGLGVYAAGTSAGDAASVAFQNAITDVRPPPPEELAARTTRRLLFYGRPEEHAARNMFELGALALSRAVETGVLRGGWELHGVGTTGARRTDPARRRAARAPPAARPERLRGPAARARRRARADVHAAPEPGADRDGGGRDAHGHQHVREQDRRGAHRDLAEPDPVPSRRSRASSRPWPRRSPAWRTPSAGCAARTSAGAASWSDSFDDDVMGRVEAFLRD